MDTKASTGNNHNNKFNDGSTIERPATIHVCMVVHKNYYFDARVRRYAEALAETGAQVDVLCLQAQDHLTAAPMDNVRVYAVPLGRSYANRGSYLLEYGVALVLFSTWLLALYFKNRYQVIHVHNMPDFLILVALIPKIFGARLILDIHDPMPEFYMSKYKSQTNNLAVRLMRVQEKFSSALAHAVITANSNFKDNLIKRGILADKIIVVHNMADPKVFHRTISPHERYGEREHFTLLYPGTIAPRYGLDVAIRALPLLITKIPQVRLVIIGPQVAHVGELAQLAEKLCVSDFVQFKRSIPLNEVPQQIINADVGIYPAFPDPHMNIATPSKVLEYAVMGIPIIASRLKVLEDLFTDSAVMFFEPGNVEQFAHCVVELYDDPARRNELVQNADRIFVHTHSWPNERSKYFNLLNRLLAPTAEVSVLDEQGEISVDKAI